MFDDFNKKNEDLYAMVGTYGINICFVFGG